MGLFGRFRQKKQISDLNESFRFFEATLEESEIQAQLSFFIVVVVMLLSLRILITGRLRTLSGEHVLNIHHLNDVNLIKEVFLAYLNAALLEPVLSIGGLESGEPAFGIKFLTNLFELFSLCWWIWLVSDAFDYCDVVFQFK
jgi:hypothetical protein